MSKRNHNPKWREEQRTLAERARMVRMHDSSAKVLKFSDRTMRRLDNGQLIRVG